MGWCGDVGHVVMYLLFLLYQGTQFLVATISIGDLLLNAVALEFVINIDELFYEVLCPLSIQRLIVRMEPFKLKPPREWSGLDLRAPLKSIVTLSMMWFFVSTELVPQQKLLNDVYTALCGGELGVLFTIDVHMLVAFGVAVLVVS